MPSGTHIPPSGLFLPAHTHSSARISNRNWKLLEIAVTPTKHSPDPVSNRNKNTHAWGRHSCLRNATRTQMNCARTISILDCGGAATALPPAATRARKSLVHLVRSPRSAISNRQRKGLEIAVTHTKQSPAPFLIDNENHPSRLQKEPPFVPNSPRQSHPRGTTNA